MLYQPPYVSASKKIKQLSNYHNIFLMLMVPWHHFKLKLRQIILLNANVGAHVHLFNVDLALISKGSGKKDTEVRKKNWVYKHIKQTTLTEINNNKKKKRNEWMNDCMFVCSFSSPNLLFTSPYYHLGKLNETGWRKRFFNASHYQRHFKWVKQQTSLTTIHQYKTGNDTSLQWSSLIGCQIMSSFSWIPWRMETVCITTFLKWN